MPALYIEPEVDPEVLKAANQRHDREVHTISMHPRARYRGGFSYPPDPKPLRPRVINVMDAFGTVTEVVKPPTP